MKNENRFKLWYFKDTHALYLFTQCKEKYLYPEYMTLSPGIPLSGGCSLPREHLRGSITFHNVSFRSVSAASSPLWAEGRGGGGLGTCRAVWPSE